MAKILGIPAAFLYTDDELLAKLLLQWGELTVCQKKSLLKSIENPAKREPRQANDR